MGTSTDGRSPLALHVLASGSKGNASIIENTRTGTCLVVDCGICKRDFFTRCEEAGIDFARIEGILVTHEHTDHTKGLGVVLRGLAKYDVHPQLFAGKRVVAASSEIREVSDLVEIRSLRAGDTLALAGMDVHPFATSHDCAESFGFRFMLYGDAIGFMTDSGVCTPQAHDALQRCRILAIESNHDSEMLLTGPYPYPLKRRIASDVGHLSNEQSATLLEDLLCDELERVVAMHISETNNTYRMPCDELGAIVERNSHPAEVRSSHQRILLSVSE